MTVPYHGDRIETIDTSIGQPGNTSGLWESLSAEQLAYSHLAPGNAPRSTTIYVPQVKAVSHPGITRQHSPNEDSYLWQTVVRHAPSQPPQSAGLFLVADGIGGRRSGKYASDTTIKAIRSTIEADLNNPQVSGDELRDRLVQAIQKANGQLFQENQEIGAFRGTTITGAVLLEQPATPTSTSSSYTAYVVNVGDSRTYRYSTAKGVARVTRDHSLVEDLVASGMITPEERYTHSRRNIIYRCVGEYETVSVDTFTIPLQPQDRLLFCSNGLWKMVHETDLAALLALPTNEPSVIASHMLHAALNRGGHDNITALVVILPG